MAYLPVSRLGDQGVHLTGPNAGTTGVIISATAGSPTLADGTQVAVEGDLYQCGISGHNSPANTLTSVVTDVFADGKKVITVNATARCGATITQGSPDVSAE